MWASRAQARATWPDAPSDDGVLDRYLGAAQEQCEEFAPVLAQDAVIPSRYVEAVVLQAREVWGAAQRDGDVIGFDTYAVRVRPLGASVRALLRPPTLRRAVG